MPRTTCSLNLTVFNESHREILISERFLVLQVVSMIHFRGMVIIKIRFFGSGTVGIRTLQYEKLVSV